MDRVRSVGESPWLERVAGHVVRPAWHVASEAGARALNRAAEAMGPEAGARLAAALASGGSPDDLGSDHDVIPLGEEVGGGFMVVSLQERDGLARAVAEARELWRLSPRQKDVLRELCEGCEATEVAKRLGISWHTARDHVDALLEKSGCVSVVEMLGKLLKMG